jgi:hypothetical protein
LYSTRAPRPVIIKRLGLNYVFISWYPDQCAGEEPNWVVVYTKLAETFPNARVGFGEIGTDLPPEKWTPDYAALASACCGVM